jgi:hypothetical protein
MGGFPGTLSARRDDYWSPTCRKTEEIKKSEKISESIFVFLIYVTYCMIP